MTAAQVLPEACRSVAAVVAAAADLDPHAPTPCRDYDALTLGAHFVGTTGAFVRAGRDHALDPEDPWGSAAEVPAESWADRLVDHLELIPRAWADPDAWTGSVATGSAEMPAQAIGEMALIEVVLHGWDLARASDQVLPASAELAQELLRCVAETAPMGRKYGAYAGEVEVPPDASLLDRALALAGRDPNWAPPTGGDTAES